MERIQRNVLEGHLMFGHANDSFPFKDTDVHI